MAPRTIGRSSTGHEHSPQGPKSYCKRGLRRRGHAAAGESHAPTARIPLSRHSRRNLRREMPYPAVGPRSRGVHIPRVRPAAPNGPQPIPGWPQRSCACCGCRRCMSAMWGHRTWCRRWSDRRQCYWTLLPTPACIHRIWPGWVRSRPEETQQTTGQGQNRHHLQVDDGPNFLVNFMCKDT